MDPINIIAGLNLIATFGANISGAKKGLKTTVSVAKEKPASYLQKLPLYLSTASLIAFILGIFQVGTISYSEENFSLRFVGLSVYLVFSWIQIWSYKSLGDYYSQELLVLKNHQLIEKGPFKVVRHPQYASQIMMDIGAGLATLSYLVMPLAVIQIPFLIMRAALEEQLLEKHFKNDFLSYKKRTGAFFPFIG